MELLSLFSGITSGNLILSSLSFWDYLVMPLGWIFKFCYMLTSNFAIALLLFTIIFKIVLFPLDIKRQKSTAKMKLFQPRISEIQKKYANDKVKQNEEMTRLNQEEGYNPMGGCLPSLLPLPIFLGLYAVIPKPLTYILSISQDLITKAMNVLGLVAGKSRNIELTILDEYTKDPTRFPFLPDSIKSLDLSLFGINLTGHATLGTWDVYWIFPVLTVLAGVISAYIMGQIMKKNNEGMPGANVSSNPMMVFLMPIFTGVITYTFPAGVLLYWIYNSILMIISNLVLNKLFPIHKLTATIEAENALAKQRRGKDGLPQKSAFREKLLEAQRLQQKQEEALAAQKEQTKKQRQEFERRKLAAARQAEEAKNKKQH